MSSEGLLTTSNSQELQCPMSWTSWTSKRSSNTSRGTNWKPGWKSRLENVHEYWHQMLIPKDPFALAHRYQKQSVDTCRRAVSFQHGSFCSSQIRARNVSRIHPQFPRCQTRKIYWTSPLLMGRYSGLRLWQQTVRNPIYLIFPESIMSTCWIGS